MMMHERWCVFQSACIVLVVLKCTCKYSKLFLMCSYVFPGGKASGSGQAGVTQHSQEADCLPSGSTGCRYGEEICQVTFCEHHYHFFSISDKWQERIQHIQTMCDYSALVTLFLSTFRKNYHSWSWRSAWKKGLQCWGMILSWGN